MPLLGKQGPLWSSVKCRVVTDANTGNVLADEVIDPQKGKSFYRHPIPKDVLHIQASFHFMPPEKQRVAEQLSIHHLRQLQSQVGKAVSEPQFHVAWQEIFGGRSFQSTTLCSPGRICRSGW